MSHSSSEACYINRNFFEPKLLWYLYFLYFSKKLYSKKQKTKKKTKWDNMIYSKKTKTSLLSTCLAYWYGPPLAGQQIQYIYIYIVIYLYCYIYIYLSVKYKLPIDMFLNRIYVLHLTAFTDYHEIGHLAPRCKLLTIGCRQLEKARVRSWRQLEN